ncbi:MAG: hypothetical protein JWQ40_4805 [Segetibacter sp.]|nr:hypothetical protein [Segetibacter sp.]
MNSQLDDELKQINNLKWLPWIGQDYFDLKGDERILIVGESHYQDDSNVSIEKHKDPEFTRRVVKELGVDKYYEKVQLFKNLHLALLGTDTFEGKLLWDKVCFYNFIQRPMDTNKGRPSKEDLIGGWQVFEELIKKIKPRYCLFVGTSSTASYLSGMSNSTLKHSKLYPDGWVNDTASMHATIEHPDGFETDLYFIRHASNFFSWKQWNEHLDKRMGHVLRKFLSSEDAIS